jgi:Arc/MetJ-type ribon-helix-helix transcriptional regulator
MSIELNPETERLVQEEIRDGNFHSVDELIVEGVHAWREKQHAKRPAQRQRRKQTLSEFLMESPLAGSELNLERDKDPGRTIQRI